MKNLASKPTDAEMLEIYSLYKQATVGDCNTSKLHYQMEYLKVKYMKWMMSCHMVLDCCGRLKHVGVAAAGVSVNGLQVAWRAPASPQ